MRRDSESLLLLHGRGANRLRRRHCRRFGLEIAHGHIVSDVGNFIRSHSNPTCRGLRFGSEVAYGHIVSDVIHLIFANPNPPERSSASSGRFHQDRRRLERGRAARRYLLQREKIGLWFNDNRRLDGLRSRGRGRSPMVIDKPGSQHEHSRNRRGGQVPPATAPRTAFGLLQECRRQRGRLPKH